MKTQPFSRYAGGKRHLIPEILRRLPEGFNSQTPLHEWFAGGAALFWHLTSPEKPQRAILCDTSPAVTSLYRGLRQARSGDIYLELAALHHREMTVGLQGAYTAAREAWNALDVGATARHVALLLYLSRRNFNGLWRVNSHGEYNVPVGKWSNAPPLLPSLQDIQAWQRAMRCVSIRTGYDLWAIEMPGSVVFADPPYMGGFTQYTCGGFPLAAQQKLVRDLQDASACGATIIATNSPEAAPLYEAAGFKVESCYRKGSINSNTQDRGVVKEIIIT